MNLFELDLIDLSTRYDVLGELDPKTEKKVYDAVKTYIPISLKFRLLRTQIKSFVLDNNVKLQKATKKFNFSKLLVKIIGIVWVLNFLVSWFSLLSPVHFDLAGLVFDTPRSSVTKGILDYSLHPKVRRAGYFTEDDISDLVQVEKIARYLKKNWRVRETWKYSEYMAGYNIPAIQVEIHDHNLIDAITEDLEDEFLVKIFVTHPLESISADYYLVSVGGSPKHMPLTLPPGKGDISLSR